jgi:small subunit ribosomal protein S18
MSRTIIPLFRRIHSITSSSTSSTFTFSILPANKFLYYSRYSTISSRSFSTRKTSYSDNLSANDDVLLDEDIDEDIFDDSNDESVSNDSNKEIVSNDSNKEIVSDDSNNEIFSDDSNNEIVSDDSNNENVSDDSNNENVSDDSNDENASDESTVDDKEYAFDDLHFDEKELNDQNAYIKSNLKRISNYEKVDFTKDDDENISLDEAEEAFENTRKAHLRSTYDTIKNDLGNDSGLAAELVLDTLPQQLDTADSVAATYFATQKQNFAIAATKPIKQKVEISERFPPRLASEHYSRLLTIVNVTDTDAVRRKLISLATNNEIDIDLLGNLREAQKFVSEAIALLANNGEPDNLMLFNTELQYHLSILVDVYKIVKEDEAEAKEADEKENVDLLSLTRSLRQRLKKPCRFCNASDQHDPKLSIHHLNIELLQTFLNLRGMIYPRKLTGNCMKHQHRLAHAIKRARQIGLLNPTSDWKAPPDWTPSTPRSGENIPFPPFNSRGYLDSSNEDPASVDE